MTFDTAALIGLFGLLITAAITLITTLRKQKDDLPLSTAQAEVAEADAALRMGEGWYKLYQQVAARVDWLESENKTLRSVATRVDVLEFENATLRLRVGTLEAELATIKNGGILPAA